MKQIINGKKYDTNTATEVCSYDNGCSTNDFNWCHTVLYKKRTGEFFFFGEGGAMSAYARKCDMNSYCGGRKIIPTTEKDAKDFAEKNMDVDDYESVFGTVEE